MYYDKSQQGNSGRQMNDSKLRRKIMADDNVKFICSRNEDVIHDKSCILTRNIKDNDLKYLVNYPKWMSGFAPEGLQMTTLAQKINETRLIDT